MLKMNVFGIFVFIVWIKICKSIIYHKIIFVFVNYNI